MNDTANHYTLKTPVRAVARRGADAGELITEVTLRRLCGRDLRKTDAAKGEVGKGMILIECSTGLSQATIDDLDSVDFENLSNLIGDMLDAPAFERNAAAAS